MISGQFPNRQGRPNQLGEARTVEKARAIAARFGIAVPEDVDFFPDEFGLLDDNTYARGPRVTKQAGEMVLWSDLIHDKTGKVPFLFRPDILGSDEGIVAVFAHEIHELESLRPLLQGGGISIEDFIRHTCPGNPGNLHDQAWDVADASVDRMRGEADR
jgi:hypothetical protein